MQLLEAPRKPPTDIPDETLIAQAKAGNPIAMDRLLVKYRPLVHIRARQYFLMGADREDLIQEGMIGLYKSVRDFVSGKSSFRSFAEICVNRQLITAIKAASRLKHTPLNSSVSLNKPLSQEDDRRTLIDVLPSAYVSDPVEIILNKDFSDDIKIRIFESLSPLEAASLRLHLQDESYAEIAIHLNRTLKSIDNALQRSKRKILRHLAGIEVP